MSIRKCRRKTLFVLLSAFIVMASDVQAARCKKALQVAAPSWITEGVAKTSDAKKRYGFASLQLSKFSFFDEIELRSRLKAAALADLSENISISIASKTKAYEKSNNNEYVDELVINTSTNSNLRINGLEAFDFFLDHAKCQAFARVALEKKTVPLARIGGQIDIINGKMRASESLNYAPLEQFAKRLNRELTALANTKRYNAARVAGLKTEVEFILDEIERQKFFKTASTLLTNENTPRQFVERATELLKVGDRVTIIPSESARFDDLISRLTLKYDEVRSVLGTKRILIYLAPNINELVNLADTGNIQRPFLANPSFWFPNQYVQNERAARILAKNYELNEVAVIKLEQETFKKFGLSQLNLRLTATLYDITNNKVNEIYEVKQSLVGRPVKNAQISNSLQKMLAELEEKLL